MDLYSIKLIVIASQFGYQASACMCINEVWIVLCGFSDCIAIYVLKGCVCVCVCLCAIIISVVVWSIVYTIYICYSYNMSVLCFCVSCCCLLFCCVLLLRVVYCRRLPATQLEKSGNWRKRATTRRSNSQPTLLHRVSDMQATDLATMPYLQIP